MDIVLIDHYDSFTNNVRDWLLWGGFRSGEILPFDEIEKNTVLLRTAQGLVFSPGPKSPRDIAPSVTYLQNYVGNIPILGVCLGHQLLASCFGWTVQAAQQPLHGAVRSIRTLAEHPLFFGLGHEFKAASYNSLVVVPPTVNTTLSRRVRVLAVCEDGDVQALEVVDCAKPCLAMQFHPESFLTPDSLLLARNIYNIFLKNS